MKPRHLLLVGMPGSGKTTAGALAASELNIPFHDADEVIETREGESVSTIFAQRGEAAFRRLEEAVVEELLDRAESSIIAPGGGWAVQPGHLERAGGRALVVHLRVGVEEAARRLAGDASRPLLGGDTLGRLRELAAAREAFYARAGAEVKSDGRSPAEVARELAELARSIGG